MEQNKESIKALNDLLQGEYMAVESFNTFISRIEDGDIKDNLKNIQSQHRDNIETLANHIQNIDGKPNENTFMKGKMGEMKLNMELGSEVDVNEVIEKALEGETKGINMAEEILRGKLDEKSRDLAGEILEKDRQSIHKLKGLLS
ncbi:DUF2383 domain-containing protein [Tissierella sp.]|uniref:DUF2383 domain-containing protein n=1 Tax=Tissierella sp. TaxID=41274 RepID=UPI0028586052|nr:DUF2383 domain-containing protein [Tissierella sp.]MDR7856963.1 DUF2383 domain-containing protein [Tissierella sp.]